MKTSSRWLDWQPKSADAAELTKPTKLRDEPEPGDAYLLELPQNPTDKTDKTPSADGFVSFVSPLPGHFQKIRALPAGSTDAPESNLTKPTKPSKVLPPDAESLSTVQERAAAMALLNRTGVRILECGNAIGIWSDLDSAAIRRALRALGTSKLPTQYLDGPGVPLRYKLRRVSGDPCPEYVRLAMERSETPWTVREQMLGRAWRFVPWPSPPAIDSVLPRRRAHA
jgi:hypothetical protein